MINNKLNELYERAPVSSATFLNANKKSLYDNLNKNKKTPITIPRIDEYLRQKETYTLHKNVNRKFHRNAYIVSGIDELWEGDLCDMTMYAPQNDNFKYLLTIIDVLTKYAFAIPLKNKSAIAVTQAFRKLIDTTGRKPQTFQTDRGKEFANSTFKALLNSRDIRQQFPVTTSKMKCGVVERFNLTLKTKMFRYFTFKSKNYRRYIDVLEQIVNSYNNTIHSVTKMEWKDIPLIYNNTHKKRYAAEKKFPRQNLQINDYVRVIISKKVFDKGYTENWSREVFQIMKIINKNPHKLYCIKDLKDRQVKGKLYEEQLQKISFPKNTVMKVLKTQGIGKNKKQHVLLFDGNKKWI